MEGHEFKASWRIPDSVLKNTKQNQSKEIKIKGKAKYECDIKYLWVSSRDWKYYGPTFTAPGLHGWPQLAH